MTLPAVAMGADKEKPDEDLTQLDLAALMQMDVKVTSVSKKEQPLLDAAAPIAVLSNDDLRRSGATTVAEALRMAPGMTVSALNAHKWAISARGFSDVFANKLLVLVDGRAVYTPLFAGVHWYLQQTMIEDVDRIEIIRGPGATVWGSNAVNGVINIVTRNAKDTQGTLAFASVGDVQKVAGGIRYGARSDENTHWRVFADAHRRDDYPTPSGASGNDAWRSAHGGWRMDRDSAPDTRLMWQAEASHVALDGDASSAYNVNTLGRWTRQISERSSVEAQAYYDRTHFDEIALTVHTADTADLSMQHIFGIGGRNDVIWGAAYRHTQEKVSSTGEVVARRNGRLKTDLFSVFLQDEFAVSPERLTLIAGSKLEHNDFTGFEFQPSVKAVFKPAGNQTVWSAVSRAVRMPSEFEGVDLLALLIGPPLPGPDDNLYLPAIVGTGKPDSEVLRSYELGYRAEFAQRTTLDIATFYNEYEGLISPGPISAFVPGTPFGIAEIPWINASNAETYGGEAVLTLTPNSPWRLTVMYSFVAIQEEGEGALSGLSDPKHQAALRSFHDFRNGVSLNAQLRYAERVRVIDPSGALFKVPSYVTADLRLSYQPKQKLELSLTGQNLFDKQRPEQAAHPYWPQAELPRSFYGKITWKF